MSDNDLSNSSFAVTKCPVCGEQMVPVSRIRAYKRGFVEMMRDRFAMAALAGNMAKDTRTVDEIAEACYLIADAMLEAREIRNEQG